MMTDTVPPDGAFLRSPVLSRPPHETLLSALEAGATLGLPFVTLHGHKDSRVLDFRAALDGAHRYAALLGRHGVKRGDRVLLLLPTSTTFIEALLGAMLAGAAPVPLAQNMTFGGAARYLLNMRSIAEDCGARVIITDQRMRDAIAGSEALQGLLDAVLTDADLEGQGPIVPRGISIGGSDTAFIQYTSGTTGRPKGAVISHRALVSNAFAIAKGLDVGPNTVGVSWLPLFHDMGLIGVVLTAVCHAYPIHLMAPETFVMHPRRWLELISEHKGTLTAAPNFAYDFCVARSRDDWDGFDLSSLRIALNGAEPVHQTTIDRFVGRFAKHGMRSDALMPVYGMAECTLAVAFPNLEQKLQTLPIDRALLEERGEVVPSDAAQAKTAVSVGAPVAGMSFGIYDEEGALLPERRVGEIRVAGPSLMDGYFRNEDATREVLVDGVLRTGDLGFIDRGRLFVTGRAKELIIKAGRNIHPYDVERTAAGVSGLRTGSVAAFARPNEETGTDDLVVMAETTELDPESAVRIEREVRGEVLAVLGVKVDAVQLCRIGGLPRTSSGKIKRRNCVSLLQGGAR